MNNCHAVIGKVYEHLKSGDKYKIIDIGLLEKCLTPVVIYKPFLMGMAVGHTWVRPRAEFEDGRFIAVDGR